MQETREGAEAFARLRELREELRGMDPLVRERVQLIRVLASMGYSRRRIAIASGLSPTTVGRIIRGRR